jgi:hypothetical protein
MGIYGEIENIDFFQKMPPFAFVKFKKVDFAIKAFDNQKTLTLLLNCPNLKIMFSDHEKVHFYLFLLIFRDLILWETCSVMKRRKRLHLSFIVALMEILQCRTNRC